MLHELFITLCNKACSCKDIMVGTSEVISNDSYTINEITLTAKDNDYKTDAQTFFTQKTPMCI